MPKPSDKNGYRPDPRVRELMREFEEKLARKEPVYYDADDFLDIIEEYLLSEQNNLAAQAIRAAESVHPGHPSIRIKRAALYINRDKPEKALELLDQLPVDQDEELMRSAALLSMNRTGEAMRIIREQIAQADRDVDLLCLDITDMLMAYALYPEILEVAGLGLKSNPQSIDLHYLVSECFYMQSDFEACEKALNRLLDVDPYQTEAWLRLGDLLDVQHREGEALEAYENAEVTTDAPDFYFYLHKGNLLARLDRMDEALATYTQAVDLEDEEGEKGFLFGCIGECYEKKGDFETAYQWFRKALDFDKADEQALIGIGICQMHLRQLKRSMATLRKAITLNPENPLAWGAMGDLFCLMEQMESAIAAYRESLRLNPDNALVMFAIGNCYLYQEDLGNTTRWFKKAEKASDGSPYLYLSMALAYTRMGKQKDGVRVLKKACEQMPDAIRIFKDMMRRLDDEGTV